MNTNAIFDQLTDEFKAELESILEFWSLQTIDNCNGGFIGQISHEGRINFKASKGAVLNTRILWTFSAAYRMVGSEKLEMLAQRAFDYLVNYFWDKKNGGLFWELDHDGNPLNVRKQAYAQGFGIYAFTEFYLATGNKESLNFAKRLFKLLELHFADPSWGGYIEALSEDWQTLEDMRLSTKEDNLPKSMNTHLHILEAYTNLHRAWPDSKLKERIDRILQIFTDHIIGEDGHFILLSEINWTPACEIVSFGHEIEGAWLLREAAVEIDNKDRINEMNQVALKLVDGILTKGTDNDGSLFYERKEGHLDADKHWWPQAEAMIGLTDAWEISGETKYLDAMVRVWGFIRQNMIDYDNGEWFGRVDKAGNPYDEEDKVGLWKCPYHNGRSMMEMIRRINRATID